MPADRRAYLFALAPVLVVVAIGPALAVVVPSPLSLDPGPQRFFGVPLVGAGLLLAGWAVHVFAQAGEPPSPAGTPSTLVTEGPLGYTRNPIYLGTVLAAVGVAVLFLSLVVGLYAVLLWVVYHLLTVYREEPALRRELGDPYEQYCEDVPRWL